MTLALICGRGRLPRYVAAAQDVAPLICVLDGFAPDGLSADITFPIETLGTLFADLRARGVTDLCLCGAITRPAIDPARLDAATAPFVPRLQEALSLGDDGALRIVMTLFEEQGFTLLAAHHLAPALVPPIGVLTRASYRPEHVRAAQIGTTTVAAMGARDSGQACILRGETVIAREDAAGTDAMLARVARDQGGEGGLIGMASDLMGDILGDASDWLSGSSAPQTGGILFKAPKPTQDRRADLPVIGPETPDAVKAAGLDGIVIEAGGVMILDLDRVVARCDGLGLFLWVREKGG